MFVEAVYGETLKDTFFCNGIEVEVVSCPATFWCGALGYAQNCTDEPDISGLLEKYQAACGVPKRKRANPEWSCAISIDYWKNGASPRGMMFAQQVLTADQDAEHDVYVMPESLYIRVANTSETAKAAFGKDSCEVYELFGAIKDILDECGYAFSTGGAQEIEMYNHGAGLFYAYVPVVRKNP